MASIVVIALPAAALTGVTQERIAWPPRCTVQAPQSAIPQPNFVPVMPSTSRNTHKRGVSPSTSTVRSIPLTLIVIAIGTSRLIHVDWATGWPFRAPLPPSEMRAETRPSKIPASLLGARQRLCLRAGLSCKSADKPDASCCDRRRPRGFEHLTALYRTLMAHSAGSESATALV